MFAAPARGEDMVDGRRFASITDLACRKDIADPAAIRPDRPPQRGNARAIRTTWLASLRTDLICGHLVHLLTLARRRPHFEFGPRVDFIASLALAAEPLTNPTTWQ